jgi:diaminohydroxyphosphoribosylaminopyrimidine deaminase / 5-amino-6-(5-phosphoribosylamino)uracil reductase
LFVNLEPCSYHGKTPPCVDLILRAGIRRVHVAMVDPNPLVSGAGIRRLRAAGINVTVGLLKDEALLLNRAFVHNMKTLLPYVHVKVAQSLDGFIAADRPSSRWITGERSRRLVHAMRASYDAVLVGAGTIIADDPLLDVRLVAGRNPRVVILDGKLRVPPAAKVFKTARRREIVLCTSRSAARRELRKVRRLKANGVNVLTFGSSSGDLPLRVVLRKLFELNIGSILVEGGAQVFSSFVRERLVQEMTLFIAPRLLGAGTPAFDGTVHGIERLLLKGRRTVAHVGDDIMIHSIA